MVDFKTKQNSVIVYFSAESLLVIQKSHCPFIGGENHLIQTYKNLNI